MTKYIRNASGGIHAVSDDHYDKRLTVTDEAGNPQPKPGYTLLTAAQARKAKPQLFGEADPNVIHSMSELVTKRKYAQELAAFRKADEEAADATTEPDDVKE